MSDDIEFFDSLLPNGERLLPFQVESVRQILAWLNEPHNRGVYLCDEMGLGKSIQALAILNAFGPQATALITCPPSVAYTWAEYCERLVFGWNDATVSILDSNRKIAKELTSRITIVPYTRAAKLAPLLSRRSFTLLIADEAHYLKEEKSQRSKAVLTYLWPRCQYHLPMSGTPFTRNVIDGYTIFNKLAPDLFKTKHEFGGRYAYKEETLYGPRYTGIKNHIELRGHLRSRFFIRREKDEIENQLPPKTFTRITLPPEYVVPPPPNQKEQYQKALIAMITNLKNGGSGIIKMGSVSIEPCLKEQGMKKIPFVVESAKNLLLQCIKLVIFAWHRDVIAEYVKKLAEFNPYVITGDVPQKDRQRLINGFRSGDTNLFIGQMVAAGIGTNLQCASQCYIPELCHSPAIIAQSIDRLHRIGQQNPVEITYFIGKGSVEEALAEATVRKLTEFKLAMG